MTLTNFGDNFEIEEDSNGDYVVTYTPTSTVIERIDSGDEEKILEVGTRISDLVDNTSGNTVYNSSTETIGDGNQDVSVESVDAAAQLSLPSYADNTNAVQDNESVWYNDGTGTDDSGYYAYDSGVIGPFGEGGGGIFEDTDSDGTYEQTTGTGIETPSVSTDELFTDAVTVYVRDGGSDSNDGLSAGSAKATVQAAIDDAPNPPNASSVVVDIGTGTFGSVRVPESYPAVKLLGDGAGSTTLDGGASSDTIHAAGSRVVTDSLTATSGSPNSLRVSRSGFVETVNTNITDGVSYNATVGNASTLAVGPSSTIEYTSSPNQYGIQVVSSFLRIDGDVTGGQIDVVQLLDSSTVIILGSVSGDGSASTSQCVAVREGSAAKVDAPLSDADAGIVVDDEANVDIQGQTTYTNINQPLKHIGAGTIKDEINNNETTQTINSSGAYPSPTGLGNGPYEGIVHHNNGGALHHEVAAYIRGQGDWVRFGTMEVNNPNAANLSPRQTYFDTANSRFIYKDSSGTAHYFTSDGTL